MLRDGACRPCPDGQFYPIYLQGVCLRCPVNMWSDQTSRGCKFCPEFSLGPGGTNLTGCRCNAGRTLQPPVCVQCPAGMYSPQGSCLSCTIGKYAPRSGLEACLACPPQTISGNGATACTPCAPGSTASEDGSQCVVCPVAYVCGQDQQPIPCPVGTYTLQQGLSSLSQCPLCPPNNVCPQPTEIQACPPHTTSPAGSIDRHKCVCDQGYKCDYTFTAQGSETLSVSPEQFDQAEFIRRIAAAAGVDPSLVQIVSISRS